MPVRPRNSIPARLDRSNAGPHTDWSRSTSGNVSSSRQTPIMASAEPGTNPCTASAAAERVTKVSRSTASGKISTARSSNRTPRSYRLQGEAARIGAEREAHPPRPVAPGSGLEQAIEERAVARHGDAQVLRGGAVALGPLPLQRRALVGEGLRQVAHHVGHERVGVLDRALGPVHEPRLDLGPAGAEALG